MTEVTNPPDWEYSLPPTSGVTTPDAETEEPKTGSPGNPCRTPPDRRLVSTREPAPESNDSVYGNRAVSLPVPSPRPTSFPGLLSSSETVGLLLRPDGIVELQNPCMRSTVVLPVNQQYANHSGAGTPISSSPSCQRTNHGRMPSVHTGVSALPKFTVSTLTRKTWGEEAVGGSGARAAVP